MNRLGQMLMEDGMDVLEVPEDKREKYRKTIISNN